MRFQMSDAMAPSNVDRVAIFSRNRLSEELILEKTLLL